jgi:membrane protease YdiL (CAAX protease family)
VEWPLRADGYLIPIAYCLIASLGTWLFSFGGFPNSEFLGQTAAAAGEEIGWRGFLVPELAKVLPFTGVALSRG